MLKLQTSTLQWTKKNNHENFSFTVFRWETVARKSWNNLVPRETIGKVCASFWCHLLTKNIKYLSLISTVCVLMLYNYEDGQVGCSAIDTFDRKTLDRYFIEITGPIWCQRQCFLLFLHQALLSNKLPLSWIINLSFVKSKHAQVRWSLVNETLLHVHPPPQPLCQLFPLPP